MLHVVVTSGGTITRIDAVRHVGNFSEGTTGARIAEEFLRRGATVHYVHARHARRPLRDALTADPTRPLDDELARVRAACQTFRQLAPRLHEHPFETFDDYLETVRAVLTAAPADVAVLAAAVSDYRTDPHPGKLSSDSDRLRIELVRLPKVIAQVKAWNPGVFQVGFKLLADAPLAELVEVAHRHGLTNDSDLTVGNAIAGGDFRNRLTVLVTPDRAVTEVTVEELPAKLADAVAERLGHGVEGAAE